jgi:LysR family transcriptional regulator, nitrogen assimilation regulatory protein
VRAALDIRQIRYFVRVVDTGSLSRAAASLHLSQPALGIQIRKLEVELGRPLLLRHSRGVVPTEDGRVVYDRFSSILKDFDITSKYLSSISGPPQGPVSLGVTASMGLVLVPPLLQLCPIELPRVILRLVDGVSEEILHGVEDGDLDLGLSGLRRDNGHLRCDPLMVEDMFLIGPRGHKAAADAPICLAEVVSYPVVLPTASHPIRRIFDEQLRKHGLTANAEFELDSVILKKELVLRSGKLTILPFSSICHELREGLVFARPIEKPSISDTMYLVSSTRRPPTRATAAVQEHIHRLVAQLIGSGNWGWRGAV